MELNIIKSTSSTFVIISANDTTISNCNTFTNSYGEAFPLEKCEIVISYFNIEANFEDTILSR